MTRLGKLRSRNSECTAFRLQHQAVGPDFQEFRAVPEAVADPVFLHVYDGEALFRQLGVGEHVDRDGTYPLLKIGRHLVHERDVGVLRVTRRRVSGLWCAYGDGECDRRAEVFAYGRLGHGFRVDLRPRFL